MKLHATCGLQALLCQCSSQSSSRLGEAQWRREPTQALVHAKLTTPGPFSRDIDLVYLMLAMEMPV